MKNIYKALCFVVLATFLVACPNDDLPASVEIPRPFADVYNEDIVKIDDFLDTHYLVTMADLNDEVVFEEIPVGGTQTPIRNMPELTFKEVKTHDITYKVYFLNFRTGTNESTTKVDSSLVSYKGVLLEDLSVTFDRRIDPIWFQLEEVVRGWGEIIPEFKTGTYTVNPDGSIVYDDFGVGVMFLPSGLAYYNQSVGNIKPYSPLIFHFKLKGQRSKDHDRDGVLSKYEYGPDFSRSAIDTDGDGTLDYLDVDDDGDGFLTKTEITKPSPLGIGQGSSLYYPFNPIADDPMTPLIDETEPKGIPDASNDGVTSTRLRRHLDRNKKPPYTVY